MLEHVQLVKFSTLVHNILNILFIAATGHLLGDTGLCCLPLNSKARSCSSAISTISESEIQTTTRSSQAQTKGRSRAVLAAHHGGNIRILILTYINFCNLVDIIDLQLSVYEVA
jgi:hypothetical protein